MQRVDSDLGLATSKGKIHSSSFHKQHSTRIMHFAAERKRLVLLQGASWADEGMLQASV